MFDNFGGPDGDACVGRAYYWYDPKRREPAIADSDFRNQHLEVSDEEWERLFAAAFDRGQRDYLLELARERPEMFADSGGTRIAMLGYTFGPCRPSTETLAALARVLSEEPTSG